MTSLFGPDTLHIAFAVAGGLFGFWLKRHPNVIPPDLQPIVDLLLQRHAAAKQAAAHDSLQALAQPIANVVSLALDKTILSPVPDTKVKG